MNAEQQAKTFVEGRALANRILDAIGDDDAFVKTGVMFVALGYLAASFAVASQSKGQASIQTLRRVLVETYDDAIRGVLS